MGYCSSSEPSILNTVAANKFVDTWTESKSPPAVQTSILLASPQLRLIVQVYLINMFRMQVPNKSRPGHGKWFSVKETQWYLI